MPSPNPAQGKSTGRRIERQEFLRGLKDLLLRRRGPLLEGVRALARAKPEDRISLGRLLEQTAQKHPHRPALKWVASITGETRQLSYREFNAHANRLARYLAKLGVQHGSVVALFAENRPELLIGVAAVAKLGAAAAMLNTHQRGRQLAHSLRAVKPSLVLVGAELAHALEEIREECLSGVELVGLADASAPLPAGLVDGLEAARAEPGDDLASSALVQRQDPALMIFTSGTTGLPKASIMSHLRWLGAGLVFGRVCMDLGPGDTLYAPLPLYHNQGLTMAWSSAITSGAALAIRRKFSVSHFWEDCYRFDATAFAYIGEIPRYLLNAPVTPHELRHRVTRVCGVGLRSEMWPEFKQRFGIEQIFEFYGASELNISFMNLLNLERTVGLCPMPWEIVRFDIEAGAPVIDAAGHLIRAEPGEVGLLLAKVTERFKFEGYTDAGATEKKLFRDAFEPGDVWVNSGDLMRSLGFGHLEFIDRVGDTFRWKSENVSTTEVEEVLNSAPAVAESTVYGVELPDCVGRAGMASIVLADAASSGWLEQLGSQLQRELPSYAQPIFLRVTASLEVTGTFKHRKVELREDGFDPTRSTDPLYVLLPGAESYAPLTPELYARIRAGEFRF